ncbi:MAG: single-stranded DNA-binding protein [Candidatus Pacebacteria bacterium]|nr:single-stranded DNA-binding protein [Candidatus Paceibacterota bacterium]
MYLNKVMLYGNLTSDPDLRSMPNGNKVTSFGLATNRSYKDASGAKKEVAEFHNIVAFGKLSEIFAQWLKKGKPVYLEGRIQTRSWEDTNGGGKKYRTEIIVDNFQFGSAGKPGESDSTSSSESSPKETEEMDTIDYGEINPDDIPF